MSVSVSRARRQRSLWIRTRLSWTRARPAYDDGRVVVSAPGGCEMSEQEGPEPRTPPARIRHEFQQPIVEELPRETRRPAQEHSDAAEGDSSETGRGAD